MSTNLNHGTNVTILLVEDNPGDVRLTQEALRESKLLNELHVVNDGEEAMAFLRREDRYVDAPRPGLILLDLNLPKKDGREVLAEVKLDEHLRSIPVVVLTTSSADIDIVKTYENHANCFITKPVNLDQFLIIVKSIEAFWFNIVQLPPDATSVYQTLRQGIPTLETSESHRH